MLLSVFLFCEQFQIFWTIVPSDTVLVVDIFVSNSVKPPLCYREESMMNDMIAIT